MKKNIHPAYNTIKATCSCGRAWNINSTLDKDLTLDTCSACHPAYTGKKDAKRGTAGGNLDKFSKKYGSIYQTDAQKKANAAVGDA